MSKSKKTVEDLRRRMETASNRFETLRHNQSIVLDNSRSRLERAQRAYLEAAGWEICRTLRGSCFSYATLCKLKQGTVWHTVYSALSAQRGRDRTARRRKRKASA